MTSISAEGTSQVMQTHDRRYVRYINHAFRRSGTRWEARYHANLVQGDRYLLTRDRGAGNLARGSVGIFTLTPNSFEFFNPSRNPFPAI